MLASGESQKEAIRPDFNRAIMIDFQGPTISSDTGFILLREIDDRFRIIDPMERMPGGLEVTYPYETLLGADSSSEGLSDCRWL